MFQMVPTSTKAEGDVEAALSSDVTTSLDGKDSAEGLISSNSVMVISKSTCAFCFELKRTLESYGVSYGLAEIDKLSSMETIQKDLQEKYGKSTVPLLFLKGELVGGCSDIKEMEHSGEFQRRISPYVNTTCPAERRVNRFTFLRFPETVNRNVVRAVGVLSFIYCILCVAFYKRRGTRYAVLGLAIDFVLRIIFGSGSSPIGMVGAAIVAPLDPVYGAGAPKQFAACCGAFMSIVAAALLLAGQELGGTIVIGALMMPTGLEGIFDFCLGCWMFGHAIRLNIVPPSVYRAYLNYYPAKKWAYNFPSNTGYQFEHVESSHVLMPGQTKELPVDLIRKDRYETEYKLLDMHAKNVTVDYFGLPLTAAALALVFKFTSDMETAQISAWETEEAFQGLGIISAIFFGFLCLVQIYKVAFYPKKIVKEWNHPIFGNFYATITICITLYGVLLFDDALRFGIVLVWIGSVPQLIMTVFRVSDLLYGRIGAEMISPAIMFAPLGNLISAFAFATYPDADNAETGDVNYVYVARLWFAAGAVLGLGYFAITLHKALLDHSSDRRLRPLLWVWLAAFAISGPAYLAVQENLWKASVGRGVLYHSLFCFSLFLFAVNSVGYLRGFYTYVADMSIWMIPFAFSALALSGVQYYTVTDGDFSRIVALFLISIACTSAAVCFAYTVMWAADLSLFTPRGKWGPVSFMKLTHEAFRASLPKLQAQLECLLEAGGEVNISAVELFVKDMESFFVTYAEHGSHEERVLFPTLRRFHPKLNPSMDEEHEHEHNQVALMEEAIKTYKGTEKNFTSVLQLLQDLKKTLPEFNTHVLEHLRNEERTITVVARKYLTVDQQKEVSRRVWELTPTESWYTIVPYVIQSLPHPMWKARFVRTFIWGNPDCAQEIGLICYRTLNSLDWAFLAEEIPEIIPRGVSGWVHQY